MEVSGCPRHPATLVASAGPPDADDDEQHNGNEGDQPELDRGGEEGQGDVDDPRCDDDSENDDDDADQEVLCAGLHGSS